MFNESDLTMTREKAIAILDSFPREGSTWGETIEACKMGADALRNAPHWISVEDELPPNNGGFSDEVLTYNRITNQCVVAQFNYISNCWFGCDDSVTHWMPLLAPPEHIADVSNMISGSSEIPNNHTKTIEKGGEE